MDEKPIAEARANLSELIATVRLLRQGVHLTRRGKPQAAIVPVELADAAEVVGGMDTATEILRKAAELLG
jgi:prevent-host-death family protein